MKRLFVLALIFAGCSSSEDSILPIKRAITESVYASVTVQPDSLYDAYAAVNGILEVNYVEEGDIVIKNDLIAKVINTTPKLNEENARLAYDLARDQLEGKADLLATIRNEITAAVITFENDSTNFIRQQNLWSQNIGSKATYDQKKLAFQLSKTRLENLKSNLIQTERELQTKFEKAKVNYQSARTQRSDFVVKSNINGKVYSISKNPGEIVSTREPLASIGSSSFFIIELLVDEVDIVKVKLGQQLIISLDAYSNQIFEGKIHKILPQKDQRSQTFTVEALFINAPETIYAGLSGEGNIIISKRENALTIPKTYLVNSTKVLTEEGEIAVETGVEDLEYIEILKGIDENTRVIKP